jgi:zinc and cadmium transporter
MNTLTLILISSGAMAVISLVGAFTVLLSKKLFHELIPNLVAFSAGALIGGAILHLIPESVRELGNGSTTYLLILLGIVLFYVLEQFIHWHHCHKETHEHKHPVSYLILIADTVHNLIDGLAIGAAFLINPAVGVSTLIAIVAHEIPQELGDFGILIHSGWTVKKALVVNFISSLTFLTGGLIVYFLARDVNVSYLLPFAAGTFIYIAAVDLIPEIKSNGELKAKFSYFAFFIVGLLIMYLV